ncbi:MAG: type II toxin-antitoxin system RelE/ParE family toxin [Mariprofundaceae bacterium]
MQVIWQPKAMKQLKKIRDKALKLRLFEKGESLASFPDCAGVKPLVNHPYSHRLRIGDWRIMFDVIEGDIGIISIEEVKKRNERTY